MSTQRQTIRQRVADAFGDRHAITTTSMGAGNGSTFISSCLQNLPGGDDCCTFEGWYGLVTCACHCSNGEVKRISASSDNTVTAQQNFSAQIGSCVSMEVYRHNPNDYNTAIARAVEDSYPLLYRPLVDESLVVGNRLTNSDFETEGTGGSTFANWTLSGTGTVAVQIGRVRHGVQSARVTAAGSVCLLNQVITPNISAMEGRNVTLGFWVWANAANAGRLRINWVPTSADVSDYHTGDGTWELLLLRTTVPSGATSLTVALEVADGNTVSFDAGWLILDDLHSYTIPEEFRSVNYVYIQECEHEPEGLYAPLRGHPRNGFRLRLEGKGMLTNPSTDCGTVEVDEPQVNLIFMLASRNMARTLWQRSAGEQRDRYLQDMQFWQNEADKLSVKPGIPMRPKGAQPFYGEYRVLGDGGSKTLEFHIDPR